MSRLQPESAPYRFRLKRWNDTDADFDDSLAPTITITHPPTLRPDGSKQTFTICGTKIVFIRAYYRCETSSNYRIIRTLTKMPSRQLPRIFPPGVSASCPQLR